MSWERLKRRVPLAAFLALSAVGARACGAGIPESTDVGIAKALGARVSRTVAPNGFVWEPGQGFADALIGRHVLFLGADNAGRRDLYRAKVRVTREGKLVAVGRTRNLTRTEAGDEQNLVARERYVAFVTKAFGSVQGVTVLDLAGNRDGSRKWWERVVTTVDNWLRVGSADGLARAEVVFDRPPKAIKIEVQDGQLVMALGEGGLPAALDLRTGKLNPGPKNPFAASGWRAPEVVKPIHHAGMDALREVLGTDEADNFKAWLFGARTRLVRWRSHDERLADPGETRTASPSNWPPVAIPPLFAHPLDDEGKWAAAGAVDGRKGSAAMMHTTIRPDPELPFATARLVAIDTRQLALRIEAGFEEPRPTTGPRGRGRIPGSDVGKAVAAFNGAFQTKHGSYGMVVNQRVLLPPKTGAQTVAIDAYDRAYMGVWTLPDDAGDTVPKEIRSLRQNLEPLLQKGQFNPAGRARWGFPLEGGSLLTERSALCLTKTGFLVYGWGIELTAKTLADALVMAGCSEAMHLDMNPGHVGFTFLESDASDATRKKAKASLLAKEMSIVPRRFLEASPKDFFYLVQRDFRPRGKWASSDWTTSAATQPEPSWLPAIFEAKREKHGETIHVVSIAGDRFEWTVRAGTDEPAGRTAELGLSDTEAARAAVAFGLGIGQRKARLRRGLILDGVVSSEIRPDHGLLSATHLGSLDLSVSVDDFAIRGSASELPLMAAAGKVRPEARTLGALRTRSAGCMLDDRSFVVAQQKADNNEAIAEVLISLGCRRVLEFNRHRQVRGFIHLLGTDTSPKQLYRETVLYGLRQPGGGGTARHLDFQP